MEAAKVLAGREALTPRAQLIAEAMAGLWREDIAWIVAQAYGKGGVVLCFGSLYSIGDIQNALK